jgi:ubiquinone/menaquinone biosynthesis C-methylase UbiE
MSPEILTALLTPNQTIERKHIHVAKGIAERTPWDALATRNPAQAVMAAKDEAEVRFRSIEQIADITRHITPSDIVLDVGSGYGRVAQYLLPTMPLAGYVGVDSSLEMLSLFSQRYAGSGKEQQTPLLLVNADIHTIPLQSAAVDVVLVSGVLLHNHKDVVVRSIEEIHRVLKPGGTLLVYNAFPNAISLMGVQGLAQQALLNLLGKPFKNGPVRYYTKHEVGRLLGDFVAVDILPVGYNLLLTSLIFLPGPLDGLYRRWVAAPLNAFFERLTPLSLRPYFATHFDVVAKR